MTNDQFSNYQIPMTAHSVGSDSAAFGSPLIIPPVADWDVDIPATIRELVRE